MTDILDMPDNVQRRSPWEQLGLLLRLVGFALLGFVALALLLVNAKLPMTNTAEKLDQMISTIILFGVSAYFYGRMGFAGRPLYHLGFRPAVRANFYLLGILLLLFSIPLESWLGLVNRGLPLPSWMVRGEEEAEKRLTSLLAVKNSFDLVLNLLVVAVIPGIFEEMFFRGALQPIIVQLTKRPWVGILITAFLFSFFHFQFLGFLPRLFLGILLGAAFFYSGSIWPCILGHCVFNGVQVLALDLYPETMNSKNPSIPAYTILVSLVVVAGLLALMRRQSIQARQAGTNSREWH